MHSLFWVICFLCHCFQCVLIRNCYIYLTCAVGWTSAIGTCALHLKKATSKTWYHTIPSDPLVIISFPSKIAKWRKKNEGKRERKRKIKLYSRICLLCSLGSLKFFVFELVMPFKLVVYTYTIFRNQTLELNLCSSHSHPCKLLFFYLYVFLFSVW